MALDKGRLLAEREQRTETVTLEGLGDVVVRGLSRAEFMLIGKGEPAPAIAEQRMVARGMVEPELSEADVARWQEISGMEEINAVGAAISRLSGMTRAEQKETYKSLRDES